MKGFSLSALVAAVRHGGSTEAGETAATPQLDASAAELSHLRESEARLRLVTDADLPVDQSGPAYQALVRLWTVLP